MRYYRWKHDLFSDIMAGFSAAVLHVPHGVAYAILAGIPAVSGLYMAVFPVIRK